MSAQQVQPATETRPRKRRRWLRILKRVVVALLLIAVILVFGVFPIWFSSVITSAGTRSMDRRLTTTPADFGARFTDVEFQTSDGVRISGWLLPAGDKRATIIYSHGLFRSRRELLQRAVDLWKLGYGALLYDSRSHGESGTARVSMGYWERLDAEAAVKYLLEERKVDHRIVLFGISMGAAAALLAAAETPEVAAVVSDSSFLSFDDTVDHHVRNFLRLPAFPLANEFKFLIQERAGFDASELNALEAVKRIGDRPIMFIAAANDKRMPPSIAQTLHDTSASSRKDLLIVDGPHSEIHGHGYQSNPQLYISRVAGFLARALST